MGKSDLFSYLSAFVTVVLAVAMTDMIQSTHRLIRARDRVDLDVRPLLFAAVIALCVVSDFFSLWCRLDVTQVTMGRLLWLLATPTIFALLAYAALPDEVPEAGLDLANFFERERRSWAVLFLIAVLLDLARGLDLARSAGEPIADYLIFAAPFAGAYLISLAALFTARHRVLSLAGLLLLAATTVYLVFGWTIRANDVG